MAAEAILGVADDPLAAEILAQPSPLRAFWAAFRENRGAVLGLTLVLFVVIASSPL